MKNILIAVLLIGLTSCTSKPKPVIMMVDSSTRLRLTPDEAIYETKVIMLGSGDTVSVYVSPEAWTAISKKHTKEQLILRQK